LCSITLKFSIEYAVPFIIRKTVATNSNKPLSIERIEKLKKGFLKQFKSKHPVNIGIMRRYNRVPKQIFPT
jgi:hypothetical protein